MGIDYCGRVVVGVPLRSFGLLNWAKREVCVPIWDHRTGKRLPDELDVRWGYEYGDQFFDSRNYTEIDKLRYLLSKTLGMPFEATSNDCGDMAGFMGLRIHGAATEEEIKDAFVKVRAVFGDATRLIPYVYVSA